jgi:hypothetical protein
MPPATPTATRADTRPSPGPLHGHINSTEDPGRHLTGDRALHEIELADRSPIGCARLRARPRSVATVAAAGRAALCRAARVTLERRTAVSGRVGGRTPVTAACTAVDGGTIADLPAPRLAGSHQIANCRRAGSNVGLGRAVQPSGHGWAARDGICGRRSRRHRPGRRRVRSGRPRVPGKAPRLQRSRLATVTQHHRASFSLGGIVASS